jgi:DNA-binding NtrC family response regulator
MSNSPILLVNFDSLVQKSLYEMLCRSGYKVDIAGCVDDALTLLDEHLFHAILADINGSDDLSIVETLKAAADGSEVIALASYNDLAAAVTSIKLGAFDYLVRPINDKKIVSTIERALAGKTFEEKKTSDKKKPLSFKQLLHKEHSFHGLVGDSQKSQEIYSVVERISNSKATVLLQGESGTGKRLVAHAIHKSDKKRRNKPFVELSCGALPRDIIESELFGHLKGAFTGALADRKGRFELAHGGTILLDDIDSLPLDLQVKLLRVLQEREFERVGDHKTIKIDVRVIATTNQDIKKLVADKKFREDLYYRINVISLHMPPLRERKEDLPLLVEHFVDVYAQENHKKIKGVSEEAKETLKHYNWPGNIRELENIIERAIILDTNNVIDEEDLPQIILSESEMLKTQVNHDAITTFTANLKEALQEPEKVHILQVLREVGWNKKKAAKKLGVNRTTLYNKLRKYKIPSDAGETTRTHT